MTSELTDDTYRNIAELNKTLQNMNDQFDKGLQSMKRY